MNGFKQDLTIDYGCINTFTIKFKNYVDELVNTDFKAYVKDKDDNKVAQFTILAFNIPDKRITFTLFESDSLLDIDKEYDWDMVFKGEKIYFGSIICKTISRD